MLKEKILLSAAFFKAAQTWMHAAHHLIKGSSFIAAHELLFGRIYQTITEDYDKLVEKLMYQFNDEDFACPLLVSSISSSILREYESPVNQREEDIYMIALALLVDHMKTVENLRNMLVEENMLTLGMDDFLSSVVNQYESYAYMINQQVKR
tara:strand:- start:265 stop:720 length:456 start_codon:yes stop_codon:yes gene_type:complete